MIRWMTVTCVCEGMLYDDKMNDCYLCVCEDMLYDDKMNDCYLCVFWRHAAWW